MVRSPDTLPASPQHPAGSAPAVDVAIVNWNTAEQALQAAGAFAGSRDVVTNLTIVDNDSDPDQKRILRNRDEGELQLLESDTNLGFGRAANLALSKGSSEFIAVSNADVRPAPGAVSAMVRAAESDPATGMVGPVFTGGGNHYHDHLPGAATLLLRIGAGGFGRKSISPPTPGQTARVEQPAGACFLMRRDAWDRVGGFDDSFFLWYEDVDLARRLIDTGHINLIVGSARMEHIGGHSFRQISERRQQSLRLSSLQRYIRLHHRRISAVAEPLIRLSRRFRGSEA